MRSKRWCGAYYMFTQVYFNVTGKALEHHLSE
jgi:hypothetical protein